MPPVPAPPPRGAVRGGAQQAPPGLWVPALPEAARQGRGPRDAPAGRTRPAPARPGSAGWGRSLARGPRSTTDSSAQHDLTFAGDAEGRLQGGARGGGATRSRTLHVRWAAGLGGARPHVPAARAPRRRVRGAHPPGRVRVGRGTARARPARSRGGHLLARQIQATGCLTFSLSISIRWGIRCTSTCQKRWAAFLTRGRARAPGSGDGSPNFPISIFV